MEMAKLAHNINVMWDQTPTYRQQNDIRQYKNVKKFEEIITEKDYYL